MISSAELTQMRTIAAGVLADLCTLQTPTETVDAQGSVTRTWADTSNVPCRLVPETLNQIGQAGDQSSVPTAWALLVTHDQAIATGQRVVFSGDTYEVIRVEDQYTWRALQRAHLRRLG